jgi:O-antigen/teichoic acid export membrane protein
MSGPEPADLARRLAANTLHAATGRVASLLLWLLLTPPLFRALGVDGFAVWSLFFALAGWLGSLDLGLAPGTLRHVAAARARGDEAAAGAFATLSVLGYAVLGVFWLVLVPAIRGPVLAFLHVPDAVRGGAEFAFVAGAVVFALAGFTNTIIAVLQASGRFDLANYVALSLTGVQAAGLLVVIARGEGVAGVVSATAVGWAFAVVAGLFALRAGVPGFRWGSPAAALSRLGETLRFGAPMQLGNVFAVAHQQVDKLMLARLVALAAVTPYELGLRIATAVSTFPQLLLLALVPAAASLHASGETARFAELHARANRHVLAASVVVTAGLCAGADRLFVAWLGEPHAAAALALRGLILAACVGLAGGVATVSARAIARTDLEAEFSIVAFVVHLSLGLWLVRTQQLTGALIALAVGNAAGVAWFVTRLARTLGWPVSRTLFAPLPVPVLALAAGWGTGRLLDRALAPASGAAAWPAALLVGGVAALVAIAVALATRYVSWSEIARLARPRTA